MWLRFKGKFLLIENTSITAQAYRWQYNYQYVNVYKDLQEWGLLPDAYEYCIRCLIKEDSSKINEKRLINFGITTSTQFMEYMNAVKEDHHKISDVIHTLNIEARKKKEEYFNKRRGTIGPINPIS